MTNEQLQSQKDAQQKAEIESLLLNRTIKSVSVGCGRVTLITDIDEQVYVEPGIFACD